MKTPSDVNVVGLGYVGLPLALAFAAKFSTTGFDNDDSRVEQLRDGFDRNFEVDEAHISESNLVFTTDPDCINDAEFIVVTVSTPVTDDNRTDLSLLESASELIGKKLVGRSSDLPSSIIVLESTTYPGCTEEFCGPIIERESGLKSGEGFLLGYSPERTNFGDADHTLETVAKVVSGQTPEAAQTISDVHSRIANAGVHLAPNIKTAEAFKVIENVQRDLNIALFNESAMIFDRMGIDSSAVFDAAGTRWNFHQYQPGLVGAHCIPGDPYYLTYAADQVGFDANVILAGRKVNEGMVELVSNKIRDIIDELGLSTDDVDVMVLGQTFKSDVADFRNSKAVDLAEALGESFGSVATFDPYKSENGMSENPIGGSAKYGVVVLAVGHTEFINSPGALIDLVADGGVLIDLTGNMDDSVVANSDVAFWKL